MKRPLIGITTSLSEGAQHLHHTYVEAVERAGGAPLILAMAQCRESLEPALARLDGLLITGGPGITEGLVGELPVELPPVEARRWQTDGWAFDAVQSRGKPVLGICYGMQFINARLGGTIYADVQRQLGTGPHSPGRNDGKPLEHAVELMPGTLLAELAGAGPAPVNSFHLKAVSHLGAGLRLSARSAEGVTEGIESADRRLVGVQFHPEKMPGTVWEQLFAWWVAQAAHSSR